MKSDAWLTYIDEFMNEYYRELPNFKSYKDCYEAIEERHKAILTGRDSVPTPFSGQCCRVGSKQIDNVANVNSQNNKFAPCSLA